MTARRRRSRASCSRLAIAGAAIWLALNRDRLDPALLESAMRDLGPWAPLAHVALFALATVLFVPGAIFGLAGGALFGPLWGTLLNLVGATLGATAAFLVARYLAADWVRRRAGPRLERLIAGVEAEGWRFVAFVRLVPLFPFNLINYALGLTRISLKHYVLASLVCMAARHARLHLARLCRPRGRRRQCGRHPLRADCASRCSPRSPSCRGSFGACAAAEAPRWIEVDELASRLKGSSGIVVIDVRGPDEFTGPLGHIAGASNLPVGELPRPA